MINLTESRNPRVASSVVCFKVREPLPLPLPLPLVEVLPVPISYDASLDALEADDVPLLPQP